MSDQHPKDGKEVLKTIVAWVGDKPFAIVRAGDIRSIADAFEAVEKERDALRRERENPPEPGLTCPHIDKLVESGVLPIEAVHELDTIRDINSQLRYGTWVLNARAEASEKERDSWRWAATQQQEITKFAESALTAERAKTERLTDKVDGLEADLESAVEVAFKRGATEWTRLNYPDRFTALSGQERGEGE